MKKLLILTILTLSLHTGAVAGDKVKCAAKTQENEQCMRYAKKDDTKCYQHSDKATRCGTITKAGHPCKVVVKAANVKCHNHTK